MRVIFTHKYFFTVVTFILGLLIGKFLLAPEQNANTKHLASKTIDVQQRPQEKLAIEDGSESIDIGGNRDKLLLKNKPLTKSKNHPIGSDNTSMVHPVLPVVRIALVEVDKLYEQPKLYWHHQLYLAKSVEDKLTAIEELVNLQETHLLASGLGDDAFEVRIATIEGLRQIANNEATQVLGQALFSEKNTRVKSEIINALRALDYLDNALIFLDYAQAHSIDN